MAYATYAEVSEWYTFSQSQSVVEKMIDWASIIVDRQTGTKFESTAATQTIVATGSDKEFMLLNTPIISITSVVETPEDGDDVTHTVYNYDADTGRVLLEEYPSQSSKVVFTFNYGDTNTDSVALAKLLTIHLTKVGVLMTEQNGGLYPSINVRKGDIQYSLMSDKNGRGLLMDVFDLINMLTVDSVTIVDDTGGYYEALRKPFDVQTN